MRHARSALLLAGRMLTVNMGAGHDAKSWHCGGTGECVGQYLKAALKQ